MKYFTFFGREVSRGKITFLAILSLENMMEFLNVSGDIWQAG